jgi:glycyl-radical enzyme activating protein/glucokinase-like ROK family protein
MSNIPQASKQYALGIDVGGTKNAAGLVNHAGQILFRYSTRAHSEKEPNFVIEAIEQACRQVIIGSQVNPADIEAIGLGFPGNTNGPAGIVLVCSNLPAWDHVPLRDIVAARLGLPVVLENDTNLCAVGEHRYGAGRGFQNMCYVTFSTGYGIGIIINNQLYVGHTGTAGELGHMVIEIGGQPCTCGKNGCVMAYASGIGLSRMAYDCIKAGTHTLLRELIPVGGQRFTGEVIAQAAQQGDEVACELLHKAGYYAGVGMSMVVQILNPEVIVLGGGLTRIGAMVLEPALTAMREHTQPELWDSVRIVPWQLGDELGIIGAAAKVFADAEAEHAKFASYSSLFILEKLDKAQPALQAIPKPAFLTPPEQIRLASVEGVIFDIQRYSLHDGPGVRTNVFFKGCPLRCDWCANPESQQIQPELALFAENCITCGQFPVACPLDWEHKPDNRWTKEQIERYSGRATACPTQAIHWIGQRRAAGEIMQEVLRDTIFYEDEGGMTLTGGEPTMQPHLAEALLRLAKAEYINTALETCGHTPWTVLESLLPYLDYILFDIKHIDSTIHRMYTGVGNELILSNLRQLATLDAPLTIRVPLIPGFNTSRESLQAIAGLVRELNGAVKSVDLLPYHSLGRAKYKALGRAYPWQEQQNLSGNEVKQLTEMFSSCGCPVSVGG